MLITSIFLGALSIAGRLAVAIPTQHDSSLLQPRAAFTTENWENDYADVNFTSGSAGQFSLEWNNQPAGDFVAGKGYNNPSTDL
jgi:hypothetical protein